MFKWLQLAFRIDRYSIEAGSECGEAHLDLIGLLSSLNTERGALRVNDGVSGVVQATDVGVEWCLLLQVALAEFLGPGARFWRVVRGQVLVQWRLNVLADAALQVLVQVLADWLGGDILVDSLSLNILVDGRLFDWVEALCLDTLDRSSFDVLLGNVALRDVVARETDVVWNSRSDVALGSCYVSLSNAVQWFL